MLDIFHLDSSIFLDYLEKDFHYICFITFYIYIIIIIIF